MFLIGDNFFFLLSNIFSLIESSHAFIFFLTIQPRSNFLHHNHSWCWSLGQVPRIFKFYHGEFLPLNFNINQFISWEDKFFLDKDRGTLRIDTSTRMNLLVGNSIVVMGPSHVVIKNT